MKQIFYLKERCYLWSKLELSSSWNLSRQCCQKVRTKSCQIFENPKRPTSKQFWNLKRPHQRPPNSQKYLHQSCKNFAKNRFKQVFLTIFEKLPWKEPNFKIAKSKYWSPNGSKSHPNGSKSPNLAPLYNPVIILFSLKWTYPCCNKTFWSFFQRLLLF